MSKNKTRKCQEALRHVQIALDIDKSDEHALPGSAVKALKQAKKKLLEAIQFRKTRRELELHRKGQ